MEGFLSIFIGECVIGYGHLRSIWVGLSVILFNAFPIEIAPTVLGVYL